MSPVPPFVDEHSLYILLQWRRLKRRDKNLSDDLVCWLHPSGMKFFPRKELTAALKEEVGVTDDDLERLAVPAGDRAPQYPRGAAIWVLFSDTARKERGVARLVDRGSADSVVMPITLVDMVTRGWETPEVTTAQGHEIYCLNPLRTDSFFISLPVWGHILKKLEVDPQSVGPVRSARTIILMPTGILLTLVLGRARPELIKPFQFPLEMIPAFFGPVFERAHALYRAEDALVDETAAHEGMRMLSNATGVSAASYLLVDPGPAGYVGPGGVA